ncbi:MAG: glycosyl transferase [Betaproteobacteria bacterium]|nr:glycosyl transferase [Betaproteobacteria bacterium]
MNTLPLVRWLVLITLLVNAIGLVTPIINAGDSVTYAALSQHMVRHGDWVNLVLDGQDWLDKPHFPFWVTALFFKVGGVNAISYNLPGFLFHLLGAYYTYRLARLFYGRDAAWLAVLVFVSAFQVMLTSTDVRAETYLTGSIMGACYYWLRHDATPRLKYLLLGALFSAVAVMTKGIFTLITISSGLVALWFYQGRWRELWQGKWWLALALTLLLTSPELLALYLQFDAHPEKLVFERTGVSGIRFFVWDSQFGRFFNTGPIRNTDGNPVFFVHVFLWAFLPWVAVAFAALGQAWRGWRNSDRRAQGQLVYLGASFAVTFGLFSLTSFQLDYYTVIVFPFAAILCGQYLAPVLAQPDGRRGLELAQLGMAALTAGLALALALYVGQPMVTCLVLLFLLVGLALGKLWRAPWRARALLLLPMWGVALLYSFITVLMTLTYLSVGLAYNANRVLATQPPGAIYVWQMDLVARELGLYNQAPSVSVSERPRLPTVGRPYYLVIRAAQLAQVAHLPGQVEPVAQGLWVVDKTGLLPRMLQLARGTEPPEDIRILRIVPGLR